MLILFVYAYIVYADFLNKYQKIVKKTFLINNIQHKAI